MCFIKVLLYDPYSASFYEESSKFHRVIPWPDFIKQFKLTNNLVRSGADLKYFKTPQNLQSCLNMVEPLLYH